MKRFVIKDETTWQGPSKMAKVGWRLDGPVDVMWGLGKADDENIAALIADVRRKHGDIDVIDERGMVSTVEEID